MEGIYKKFLDPSFSRFPRIFGDRNTRPLEKACPLAIFVRLQWGCSFFTRDSDKIISLFTVVCVASSLTGDSIVRLVLLTAGYSNLDR